MSDQWIPKGLEGFADGTHDWDTNTYKTMLADLNDADLAVKAITGATNATPIVITATAHGFANGDLVVIGGVGGNLAANGTWLVANQAANTFELTKTTNGGNSVGSAAYTSGGYAVNLTLADNIDDVSAGRVGTDQTLGSKTLTNGVLDAADVTYTALTGDVIEGLFIYRDTGAEATSRTALFKDGKIQVIVAADAASSAVLLWVEPLQGDIANGTAIVFSNGVTATLTAGATEGARSLTVSALASAIAAGNTADVTYTNANLPFTPNGGNLTVQWSAGANRIAKL